MFNPSRVACKGHLRECLLKTESEKKPERATDIKQKTEREGNKKMWYFINWSQKDPRSIAAPHVVSLILMVGGVAQDSTRKSETEQFVFNETEYCFRLAADAPISKIKLLF